MFITLRINPKPDMKNRLVFVFNGFPGGYNLLDRGPQRQ